MFTKVLFIAIIGTNSAFIPVSWGSSRGASSALNLDPKIAKMLDKQYFGMTHPEEAKKKEKQFHERNAQYLSSDLPDKFEGMVYSNEKDFVQYRKDKKLAQEDPQGYCADRCITTGNCDVYEDIFDFSPDEVMAFCSDCVLSEEEEPCDLPPESMDAFFDSVQSNYDNMSP